MDDLETQLVKRLMRPDYLAFFKRLAPVHQRESLLHVKPMWIDWLPIGSPGKIKPAQLDKPLTLTKITGNLFHAIILRRFSQIESDACEVAVPTAQVDAISRQKRLQFYADLGKSLLFFAASFVPDSHSRAVCRGPSHSMGRLVFFLALLLSRPRSIG